MIDLTNGGTAVTPGVVETIVTLAVKDIDGIASVGNPPAELVRAVLHGKPNNQGVDIQNDEDGSIKIAVHINVKYGKPIPEIAAKVQKATIDAVTSQIGIKVSAVDVFVDSMRFNDK